MRRFKIRGVFSSYPAPIHPPFSVLPVQKELAIRKEYLYDKQEIHTSIEGFS